MVEFKKPNRREIELDFVRGLAILAVVDFHSPQGWLFYPLRLLGFKNHFGWMGVDLFFVLSGFLIGGLLVKEWMAKGKIASRRFLIRRGMKIWPPYYVLIAIMLLTRHRSLAELWGNILNIQNYVGGIAFTWSLAVEEHAYLFLLLVLALAARLMVRMRSLFLFLGLLSAVVVLLRLFLTLHHSPVVYTATHTRIDGIFYGVMLAMLYHMRPESFHRLQNLRWLWLFLVFASLAFFRWRPNSQWGTVFEIDVANVLSIALLLLLYRHRDPALRRPLPYRLVAWIGLYSYGIYLWHVSMVAPLLAVSHRLPHVPGLLWEGLAPIPTAILAGVVATKLVEFPTLKLRDRLFPGKVDSAVGTPA